MVFCCFYCSPIDSLVKKEVMEKIRPSPRSVKGADKKNVTPSFKVSCNSMLFSALFSSCSSTNLSILYILYYIYSFGQLQSSGMLHFCTFCFCCFAGFYLCNRCCVNLFENAF